MCQLITFVSHSFSIPCLTDPNAAAYYADPNAHHPDPYGQHAYYHQASQQQYHYA